MVVEGIENKVKKLIYLNQQLSQENLELKEARAEMNEQIKELQAQSLELQDQINKLKVAKVLTGRDNFQARHQINELLREIEKCYTLLNR